MSNIGRKVWDTRLSSLLDGMLCHPSQWYLVSEDGFVRNLLFSFLVSVCKNKELSSSFQAKEAILYKTLGLMYEYMGLGKNDVSTKKIG